MSRLIDADALILALETQDYSGAPESLEDWTPQDVTKVEIYDINNAPTIDAEPVRHGKIVNISFGDSTYEGCSLCGADYNRYYSHGNYCSYCGAKFEEVKDEVN